MRLAASFGGSVFSDQASAAIGEAFAWLHDFRDISLPPVEPFARPAYVSQYIPRGQRQERRRNRFTFTPDQISLLRIMAENCTHSEIGGRAMFKVSDHQAGGEVVGRTVWVGKPDWALDAVGDEIAVAVEKAIDGSWLGKRQETFIEVMLAEIEATRANCAPQVQAPDCPF